MAKVRQSLQEAVFTAMCLMWSHAAAYVVGRRSRARGGPAGLFGHIGVLPHPVPITTVIGRPINVPKYEGAPLALCSSACLLFAQFHLQFACLYMRWHLLALQLRSVVKYKRASSKLPAGWTRPCFYVLTSELCKVDGVAGPAAGNFQSEEGRALVDKYHAMFVAGLQQVRSQPWLHHCMHAEQAGLESGAGG